MAAADVDQRIRDTQREYAEFLDDYNRDGIYTQLVKDMVSSKQTRLIVNINDLRRVNPQRAQSLLIDAFDEQLAFQRALREFIGGIDSEFAKEHEEFSVGFEGSFGAKHVTPRTLTSRFIGNMVCVEGIVTKCSLVRPKLVRSVHYCPATKKTIERRYTDLTSFDAFPSSAVYPTKDEDGNLLETEYGLSVYKDHQTMTVQEMPEKAPAGQLPRAVDIICDHDLVDKCKPGDRVQVIGTFRSLPGKQGGFTSGAFKTILLACNVVHLSKEASIFITSDDVRKCKKFSRMKSMDVFHLLGKSLAPSIHGHEYIKRALLCMLLGGLEKVLPNGTRLRGDINILLIGDPSVAKSQLLRYVLHTAPRAVATTGRGSSGVGLTAAVTTDPESGERRLEAGAMVLADRGVVCIDEFDKMSDIDRTAIHEVMEQGQVTIAKAGIHARLNARCSVLAAANPVYGRYDQYKTPMENIGLQDSLLSRFDLLFIVLDLVDVEQDRKIADHVVRMHRYRSSHEQDGDPLPLAMNLDMLSTSNPEESESTAQDTPIYEKYDALLHGNSRSKTDKIVSMQFMKKYIHVARALKPTLSQDAADSIAEEYSRLRSHEVENPDVARTQPVTARALETLIRLSTAHARARLSKVIEADDAQAAIELVQFAYFKRILEKPKKRRKNADDEATEDEEAATEDEEEVDDVAEAERIATSLSQPKKRGRDDPYDWDDDTTEPQVKAKRAKKVASQSQAKSQAASSTAPSSDSMVMDTTEVDAEEEASISDDRFNVFKKSLTQLFRESRAQSIAMTRFNEALDTEHKSNPFKKSEITAAFGRMTEANQIMVADDIIFLI